MSDTEYDPFLEHADESSALTVHDLIAALQALPPDMEIWKFNVGDKSAMTRSNWVYQFGWLYVGDGKLWFEYDSWPDDDWIVLPLK